MRMWRLVLSVAAALVVCAVAAGAAAAGPAYVQVAGSPFAGGSENLWSAAFSPTGSYLATGNYFNSEITMLAVNPATGELTVLGQKSIGPSLFPNAVEFGTNSRTMFLGVATDNSAELFSVSSLGNLTQLGTPSTLAEGPTALDFNSAGTRLAVATYGGVQMYAVGNAGLTARPFKPFTGSESGVAFNPSGHLLAVSLQDSTGSACSRWPATGA